MKLLKVKLHISFDYLLPGETFIYGESPHIKVGQPVGGKLTCTHKRSHVNLESGVWYVASEDMRVEKVELGITGLEKPEFDD